MELFGHVIGTLGIAMFLWAYFLLQKGTWKPDDQPYLLLNLLGALLIMGSLCIDWNLSAFLLEAAWALISIWGLIKRRKARALS